MCGRESERHNGRVEIAHAVEHTIKAPARESPECLIVYGEAASADEGWRRCTVLSRSTAGASHACQHAPIGVTEHDLTTLLWISQE